jgi:hypothetical protein
MLVGKGIRNEIFKENIGITVFYDARFINSVVRLAYLTLLMEY